MDKLDEILSELQTIKSDIIGIKDNQEKMRSDIAALRVDKRGIHKKLDVIIETTAKNTEDITELKAL